MSTIVITGAGGFVGGKLVARLRDAGQTVVGIGRGAQPANWPEGAAWVKADLLDPPSYEAQLAGAKCVVHLAAITGKAKRAEYERGNVDATDALLRASVRAGVERFVFVSSIATTFADRRSYHYADSKIAAEALVREAPIASVIVRPTMILGPGSPIEGSLGMLAGLPVSPVFGDGRRMVQPVDVEDVVDALCALARGTTPASGVIELGGPERYDLRELYARLRSAKGAAGAPKFVQLPLGLTRWGLSLVEAPLLPVLPLTAGQLATFANDGVATPHEAHAQLMPNARRAPRAVAETPPPPPSAGELDAEFTRHARYLIGVEPTAYQLAKYRDFHAKRRLAPANAFDGFLLKLSRGGLGLALADSYSGLLYRTSVVRAKLVLAAAILESSAPSFEVLDTPGGRGGALASFMRMGCSGMKAGFSFFFAALLLLPAHILLRAKPAR
jgi:nucleoside-diphosphate-sugar epimerase